MAPLTSKVASDIKGSYSGCAGGSVTPYDSGGSSPGALIDVDLQCFS